MKSRGAIGAPQVHYDDVAILHRLQHLFERLADAAAETVRRGVVALRLQAHRQCTSDHPTLPDSTRFDTGKHAQDRELVERVGDDRSRVLR